MTINMGDMGSNHNNVIPIQGCSCTRHARGTSTRKQTEGGTSTHADTHTNTPTKVDTHTKTPTQAETHTNTPT